MTAPPRVVGWAETDKLLHVHGQREWHDEVIITGTRVALLALGEACLRAARGQMTTEDGFFVNDGEGFIVVVVPIREPLLDLMLKPYSGEDAAERREPSEAVPWLAARRRAGEVER